MIRILLIVFLSLFFINSVFPLDYYTMPDKENKNKANLYSPKKENTDEPVNKKAKDRWQFVGENADPNDPQIYEKPKRCLWRMKIEYSELPYKYVEKVSDEDTIPKRGKVILQLVSNEKVLGRVECIVEGKMIPRPTGFYYQLDIKEGKMIVQGKQVGIVQGKLDGKFIGKRVNFNIVSEILVSKKNKEKIGSFNGSFTFGLTEKDGFFEKGLVTFFARYHKPNRGWKYGRIQGKIKGNTANASLVKTRMIDVDGRLIGNIEGDFKIK